MCVTVFYDNALGLFGQYLKDYQEFFEYLGLLL